MTGPLPQRTDGCFRSTFIGSLSRRSAGSGTPRNSQTQYKNASQSQTVASLRNEPTRSAKPHQNQRSLRSNIHENPFSSRVALPAPFQLSRDVSVAASLPEGPELDWLPSENRGNSEFSIRITSELLIAPKGIFDQNTQNFVRDLTTNHNKEVPFRHPRMYSRELGDEENPCCWELLPLETGVGPPKLGSPCKYQLKTPIFTLSDDWQGFFRATWGYLRKYYMIQGINGLFPAVFIQISTSKRALDFKRIVQALIHFNPLWPKTLGRDDMDPDKAEPRICVGQSYLSHHPDYWSTIPANGLVFFHIGRKSEVGEGSIAWTQFVMTFVISAVDSPSLAYIQSHPVTRGGLDRFLIKDPRDFF